MIRALTFRFCTVAASVRVAVARTNGRNSTLRCYTNGFYPRATAVMDWYSNVKDYLRLSSDYSCRPFSDGTYQCIADYTCPTDDVYDVYCQASCVACKWYAYKSLERDFGLCGSTIMSVALSTFTVMCMLIVFTLIAVMIAVRARNCNIYPLLNKILHGLHASRSH